MLSVNLTSTAMTLLLLVLIPQIAFSSLIGPSGGLTSSSPFGADDFMAGLVPPPGVYLLNYTFYYSAHKFKDHGGEEVKKGPFDGFKTEISGNIFRFAFIPKDINLFGARWFPDMGIPIVSKEVETKYTYS